MSERRDIKPEEMAVIGELALAAPDLVAVRDKLLAALKPAPAVSGGRLAWSGATLRPTSWKELTEAVKLGILHPKEAARYVDVPGAERGFWRSWWLQGQRGGGAG